MTINDDFSFKGNRIICLNNEKLRIVIIPKLGGVITSLKYLPEDFEFLANLNSPKESYKYFSGRQVDNLLDLMFVGGYYEIIPNAGYISEYQGSKFGLHDETPYLEWKYEYDEDRDPNSVLLIVSLQKFPFKLYKRLTLQDNSLIITEKLVNLSPTSQLPFSWLHHPTFGQWVYTDDVSLDLPVETPIEVDSYLPQDNLCLEPGYKGEWPLALNKEGDITNLYKFNLVSNKSCDDLVYVPKVLEGYFKIINRKRNIILESKWDKDVFSSLWLWRAIGGGKSYPWFGRIKCAALEISTSYPATGLADQVKLNTAKWLAPLEELKTTISYTVHPI